MADAAKFCFFCGRPVGAPGSSLVPASATVYKMLGVSKVSTADRLDREMQGVIASFHVEKVPVSITNLEVIETALSDWQSLNGREHRK